MGLFSDDWDICLLKEIALRKVTASHPGPRHSALWFCGQLLLIISFINSEASFLTVVMDCVSLLMHFMGKWKMTSGIVLRNACVPWK